MVGFHHIGDRTRAMSTAQDVIAAFSEDQVTRLTGVSKSQLRYWDRTDFYQPSYAEANRRVAFSRIYSFKDIVALRVLHVLRNQYKVPLPHLRQVSVTLAHLQEERWTGTKLWVLNKRVIWQEPNSERPQEIVSQQYVVPLEIQAVVADTHRDVAQLIVSRDENMIGVIVRNRYINHNDPIIAGTRIPVETVQRYIAAGFGAERIIADYPDLTVEDVRAARNYEMTDAAA